MDRDKLRRTFFGYDPRAVQRALADREEMFARAARATRAAESESTRLQQQLAEAKAEVDQRTVAVSRAEARADELARQLGTAVGELDGREAERRALQERAESLAEELASVRAESAAFAEELSRTRTRLDDAQAELESDRRALSREFDHSRMAEGRVAELEAELATAREQLRTTSEQLTISREELRVQRELPSPAAAAGAGAPAESGPTSPDDVSQVLLDAERAVVKIVEGARRRADQELRLVQDNKRRIEAEVAQLRTWQGRIAPLVGAIRTAMDDSREGVSGLGVRIRAAVEPAIDSIEVLRDRLDELAEAASSEPVTDDGAIVDVSRPGMDEAEGDATMVGEQADASSPGREASTGPIWRAVR